MTSLALETSTRAASVAVRHGDRTVVARLEAGRAQASDLFPALERLMQELGADPRRIEVVVVGTGPGSYTGLRVGIATALGIARGSGAQLVGVPSGEALVFGRVPVGAEAVFLLDARSGEVYFARYRRTETGVEVVEAPGVLKPGEVAARIPARVPIFGDATVAEVAELDAEQRARLVADAVPRAEDLLELGLLHLAERGPTAPDALEPLYLRPFAATTRKR
ncbi:MAG: tRNA (adenosine(37)-N6)-threonylcarbamoyltransferase complex dimerization subunit type 1 TsaB [Planctomycetes bacterium]|nr:tRNA (adenosine(37)-N6)-threonylcarbamoyltransferase complex dimerization subunit type 1 TsaB [Planctomycetota bacterium]